MEIALVIAVIAVIFVVQTIKIVPQFGFEVIYGDTDSVYLIKSGPADGKDIMKQAMEFLGKINSELPEAMELEFEGFYPRGIFITKKRYAIVDEERQIDSQRPR